MNSVRITCLIFICILSYAASQAQDGWDWKDPNDLGFVDFGDNKLLGYNLGALGIRLLLKKDQQHHKDRIRMFSSGIFKEYKREPLSTLYFFEGRYGVKLRKFVSLGGGGRLYVVSTKGDVASGLGGFVWFKWHLFQKDYWRLSYENGVGPNYFFEPFPTGGTRFNFTTHYGLSFDFLIAHRWWNIKFSNIHISNADIKGKDRNPALDGIGVFIGIAF